jgi:hypothetical protein
VGLGDPQRDVRDLVARERAEDQVDEFVDLGAHRRGNDQISIFCEDGGRDAVHRSTYLGGLQNAPGGGGSSSGSSLSAITSIT